MLRQWDFKGNKSERYEKLSTVKRPKDKKKKILQKPTTHVILIKTCQWLNANTKAVREQCTAVVDLSGKFRWAAELAFAQHLCSSLCQKETEKASKVTSKIECKQIDSKLISASVKAPRRPFAAKFFLPPLAIGYLFIIQLLFIASNFALPLL